MIDNQNKNVLIQIFGEKSKKIDLNSGGCGGYKSSRCSSCENDNCCGCRGRNDLKSINTIADMYGALETFIRKSDVCNNVKLEFIDISKCNNFGHTYPRIKELIDKGYEDPFTVIDGVIRYYGSISNILIYKDILELIE
ncbi:hypothetical protein D4Z93_06005 [Clostridium fermenticellae]|uniref:Arsenical resistance operon transcriptional repressor ArsD n=1 Tax=Clostridium fermenticellae TaxID=2068654 RepID=A0A386H3H4_9CLOT|nr:hypothetical protein [Clostridium fermenticellae]AYD40093.1 hypothetical protein D4Z93_06005 [Clostridium fermenticellae]